MFTKLARYPSFGAGRARAGLEMGAPPPWREPLRERILHCPPEARAKFGRRPWRSRLRHTSSRSAQSAPSTPRQRAAQSVYPWGSELPLVGRRDDLSALRRHLNDAIAGQGHCVLLTGEAGGGKSRLLATLKREALAKDVLVASGTAFAMEAGVTYGALADALSTPLRALDAATLTVLARGAEADLHAIVPGLAIGSTAGLLAVADDIGGKARLLWNVSQFLARLARRQTLLLVLDNVHECDPSSLEFLHFLARQVSGARVLIVMAYVEGGDEQNAILRGVVRSLLAAGEATLRRVEPLTRPDLAVLLQRVFSLPEQDGEHHAASLWSHTRGNPFFVEESLKALAASGHIRRAGSRWVVDDSSPGTLPATVRDAVLGRLDTLTADARRVADIAAILDSRAPLAVLGRVSQLDALALADAIDALCLRRILVEVREHGSADYEFGHPIIQATLRGELTTARARALHVAVAAALESQHGDGAPTRAMAIVRHLALGQASGGDERTLRYLTEAGRDALARRADQEAARWLGDALALADRVGDDAITAGLLEDVATAQLRIGDAQGATADWARALQLALRLNDREVQFRIYLAMAQDAARNGNATNGLALLVTGESVAAALERPDLVVHARVERMRMLQVLGRAHDAAATIAATLAIAAPLGSASLLARVHQAATQLYAWTGPAIVAREHGTRALALSAECGEREVAWAAHWAMAMLEGFTGHAAGVAHHLREAGTLADALASLELQSMTAEIAIEHASVVGQWDEALALAERTMPLARATMPNPLLPRLLVWTGLIVLARDEVEQARALFEEAWNLSGAKAMAGGGDDGLRTIENVHNVILAHTGMGALRMAEMDWVPALEYLEAGLSIADRFGYVAWAIHRLLPLIIEARLRVDDFAQVEALTHRLREQSVALNHRLGMAWAAAADALVARVLHHSPDAAERLLAAADALDAVPFVFHGAKLRRNAAQVLEADGDVAGAVRELRSAHDVFLRLGAEFELRGARNQLRVLGVRLPPRTAVQGAGALTGRELEIARAVARRLSNKEIGAQLDISARTVSTHLSNIFEKLQVQSRGELADHVREHPLLGEGAVHSRVDR